MKALIPTMVRSAEYSYSRWCADVPHETRPDEVLDPKVWAHLAATLRTGDEIRVKPVSNEWVQYLIVLDVGKNYAVLARIGAVHPIGSAVSGAIGNDADYEVSFKGPIRKWAVIRKADKAIVYEGFNSRDAADAKLADHTGSKVAIAKAA